MDLIEEYADVSERASIDEAYSDCTKRIDDTGRDGAVNIEEYATKIKDTIKQQCGGLPSSIGVSPTKTAAKIASDFKKPEGSLMQNLQTLFVSSLSFVFYSSTAKTA
jgi:DNA polymerase IV (DinB-like DNA polymerase)